MAPVALRSFILATVALCSSLSAANPVQQPSAGTPFAVKETYNAPASWKKVGSAPSDAVLDLQVGLMQGKPDELEAELYQISDPDHARYGKYLTPAEVDAFVAPTRESKDAVLNWLKSSGVEESKLKWNRAKDWVTVSLQVSEVEKLLDTKYAVYEHQEDKVRMLRTTSWSLPQDLHDHVDIIQPTTSFIRTKSTMRPSGIEKPLSELKPRTFLATNGSASDVCSGDLVTPDCLRTLYQTKDYVPKAPGLNQVALTNYLGEVNNRTDTRLFLQQYRPDAVDGASTFRTVVIDNGDDQQTRLNSTQLAAGTGIEGALDAQTILGITYSTPLVAYNIGGRPPFNPDLMTTTNTNEPYLAWQQHVLGQDFLPQVVSNSYGDDEQSVPFTYARRVCRGFAELGARGTTVLFSSGDNGVGKDGEGSKAVCFSNDGKFRNTFLPSFPASCPFVTTVGGTRNFNPEVVAFDVKNGFVGGSGFSDYFPRPEYQEQAVSPYVEALGDKYSGLYNRAGRAYPDISAQSFRYAVVYDGKVIGVDGTSASCPTVASIVALLNDARIAAGKPPMGFLNPFLYKKGFKGVTDITIGAATGCNTDGFPATTGWDAATGFGTPIFTKLKDLALE